MPFYLGQSQVGNDQLGANGAGDSGVSVTPEAASAVGASAIGDVVSGSIAITPNVANGELDASIGTIIFGSLSLTPDAAIVVSDADSTTVLGSITITPENAYAEPFANGSVLDPSITVTPESASSVASASIGDVIAGNLTLTPDSAISVSDAAVDSIIQGSLAITPDIAYGESMASIGAVVVPFTVVQYVGELGRYQLYEAVFTEDYALYAAELSSYRQYNGTLVFLNEEGIVIEKAIVGQVIAPKFTLLTGTDHSGDFEEPDTVTIKFRWGDGTEETFTTDDDVTLDSENAGVYYVARPAAIEGTATIYALAEWTSPAWSVAKNKRIEVVGEFET